MLGKRILVTGATGFIGLNLVKSLISQGHRVSAMVRAKSSVSKTNELKRMGAVLVRADLQKKTSLARAVANQQIIFNLAVVARAVKLATFKEVNFDGFANLLESVIAERCDAKLVHISSLSAAGPSKLGMPNREEFAAAPISNYGKSKLDAEKLAVQFSDRLNISIVRPPIGRFQASAELDQPATGIGHRPLHKLAFFQFGLFYQLTVTILHKPSLALP